MGNAPQIEIFPSSEQNVRSATFSEDGQYRYTLLRWWDQNKPKAMFIGLNPSTANETEDDATIESVTRICRHNGYGGFYMMNCWAFIATKPKDLKHNPMSDVVNNQYLTLIASRCRDVVFAWGAFKVIKKLGRDRELIEMFPHAKCIGRNSDGSPKHPLFQKSTSTLIPFNNG